MYYSLQNTYKYFIFFFYLPKCLSLKMYITNVGTFFCTKSNCALNEFSKNKYI